MKLTENTLSLLQNYATIQPNVLFGQTNGKLKTISEAKNIFAVADIPETFDTEIGIYDLNEFLSALTLVSNPDLEFTENSIKIKSGDSKTKLNYACANTTILTFPQKDLTDPSYEIVDIIFSAELLASIKKAAAVLGHDTFSLIKTAGSSEIEVKVHDIDNSSSNSWTSTLAPIETDAEFEFHFMINNLKLIPGNYKVSLSSKLISKWQNEANPVTYWIAIEHTSNYKG